MDLSKNFLSVCMYVFLFIFRKDKYKYKPGTTPVLTENVVRLDLELLHETVQTMETAWAKKAQSVMMFVIQYHLFTIYYHHQ